MLVAPESYDDDSKRPATEAEEARIDLPSRTPKRIWFLLKTYEAGRMDRTEKRIGNDRIRFMNRRATKPSAEIKIHRNPQAHVIADPSGPIPSVATFGHSNRVR